MLYPSIDELKKRADSRYTLVMVASKRARDLIDGYPALVDIGNEKPVSIATEEIAEDMISYSRRTKLEDEQYSEEEGSEITFDNNESEEIIDDETSGEKNGQDSNAETSVSEAEGDGESTADVIQE